MDTKQFPAVPATDAPANRSARRRLRLPARGRRPAILLATAAAGAVVVSAVVGAQPAAEADTETVTASMSVAEQLGINQESAQQPLAAPAATELAPLQGLAASRSERQAAESQAAQAPAAGGSSSAPRGSFKEYAMSKVGSAQQFSCLENLWGKESGWNPNAQKPSSTAYGIPQFLNSTWASTGIAKTSDGYRQIDAGLIYIERAYGSPCAAWGHS